MVVLGAIEGGTKKGGGKGGIGGDEEGRGGCAQRHSVSLCTMSCWVRFLGWNQKERGCAQQAVGVEVHFPLEWTACTHMQKQYCLHPQLMHKDTLLVDCT